MSWLPDVVCDNISNLYDCKEFRDGKATGSPNRFIKRNQEMIDEDGAASKLFQDQWWNSDFAKLIMVKSITVPMFIKYVAGEKDPLDQSVGGFYNWRNDLPIMGKSDGSSLRSDYVMVTAINDCNEYEGGGLMVRYGTETYEFRLQKGESIFFDPNLWHSVNPVTKGERRVSVMWVETLVQDEYIRELIYDYEDMITNVLASLDPKKWKPDIDHATYLNSVKYKLMRKFADTYRNK